MLVKCVKCEHLVFKMYVDTMIIKTRDGSSTRVLYLGVTCMCYVCCGFSSNFGISYSLTEFGFSLVSVQISSE